MSRLRNRGEGDCGGHYYCCCYYAGGMSTSARMIALGWRNEYNHEDDCYWAGGICTSARIATGLVECVHLRG